MREELQGELEIARLTEGYLRRKAGRIQANAAAFSEDELERATLEWKIAIERVKIAEARLPR
jgi:hypothetical protein